MTRERLTRNARRLLNDWGVDCLLDDRAGGCFLDGIGCKVLAEICGTRQLT